MPPAAGFPERLPRSTLSTHRGLSTGAGHEALRLFSILASWYDHGIDSGFRALEQLMAGDRRTGEFCHGEQPSLADIALVPQVVNAERYRLDLAPFPTIKRIFETCMKLDAFAAAHPGQQPDRDE